ncbi:hypothetical protein GCM10009647_028700 [Streptomyces sanglieri]
MRDGTADGDEFGGDGPVEEVRGVADGDLGGAVLGGEAGAVGARRGGPALGEPGGEGVAGGDDETGQVSDLIIRQLLLE